MISDQFNDKNIDDVFSIIPGNIVNLRDVNGNGIIKVDAIVNAAKPTLMGGSGVDGAIHDRVGRMLNDSGTSGNVEEEKGFINGIKCMFNRRSSGTSGDLSNEERFNRMIKRALGETEDSPNFKIRCKPGDAVTTKLDKEAQEFSKYIIHAVGSKYDGGSECVRTLKKCYDSIMDEVFKNGDIKTVAMPVISSGNYGFPFELALRVAIASIGNRLLKEKNNNYDNFARLEKIYLVIYEQRHHQETAEIYSKFEEQIGKEKHMVFWGAWEKQVAYCREILKNDSSQRNYFTLTKMFRLFLVGVRFLFPIPMLIERLFDRFSWKIRREVVEINTLIRTFIPVVCFIIIGLVNKSYPNWIDAHKSFLWFLNGVSAYFMLDTITCLLSLIFLTDLMAPSANRLRTIILLMFNYIGMLLGIAQFYYTCFWRKITVWQALDYSVLDRTAIVEDPLSMTLRVIEYSKAGIQFFFLVLTFTFFVSHLRQRSYME